MFRTRTIHMHCVLKSGAVVKDRLRINKNDDLALKAIYQMKTAVEGSIGYKEPKLQNITFGHTTIAIGEVAAIKIW